MYCKICKKDKPKLRGCICNQCRYLTEKECDPIGLAFRRLKAHAKQRGHFNMKIIEASELIIRNIFTYEMKVIDRESLTVLEKYSKLTYKVESNNTFEKSIIQFEENQQVIFLRNDTNLRHHPQTKPIEF